MANDFQVLISAAIDIQKAQNRINSQIDKLKVESIKVGISLDNASAKKAIKELSSESQRLLGQNKTILDNKLTTYLKENTKLGSKLKSEIQSIQSSISNVDTKGLKDLQKQFTIAKTNAESLGETGRSVLGELGNNLQKFASWYGIAGVTVGAVNSIKDMVKNVSALDDSLIELRKVSDLSGVALERFTDKAYAMGAEVARTGQEVIDATTTFKRAGYTLDESFDLAKTSLVMVNVGDGISNVTDAASALIATLKGFKLSDTDALSVVDMINETSNNAPIDFDNITEGLRRVSGTLSQTGASIQETIGLLTGGFGSLRDIEMVSSGLIMVSQRLRGIDQDGNAIEGLAPKLKKEFKEIANIDIEDSNGNLRNTYDILTDMAKVFPTLTSKQQQYLGELAAGNRQIKVLNAIVQGWEDVESATTSATKSQGSALKENEKVIDGITGKTNAFKSAFQELSSITVNSDWVKFFIDLSTYLVKATTAVGGLVPVLLTVGAIFLGFKANIFPTLIGQIQLLILAQTGYTASSVSAALAQVGLAGAIKATTTAMISFLATNPVGWAILASGAIFGAVKAYDYLNISLEENQEALSKLKGEYDSITSEVKSLEEQISSVQSKMKEMERLNPIEFVNDNEYQKLSDSNDQLDRRLTIQKELQKIAAKEAEEKAIETIGQKSENSIVNVKTIHSDYSGTSVKAEKITRDVAIKERIEEYDRLTLQIEELENKQYALAKASNTESKEYKNLTKELSDIAEKRDDHYEYILSTMDALESESESIVGATKDGEEYASTIDMLGSVFDDFIKRITGADNALSGVSNTTDDTVESTEKVVESLYSLAKAAEVATGYVNDLAEDVDISKLQDSVEDAISSIKDFNSILQSLDDNNGLTSDDLDAITQKYPQLLSYIGNEKELRKQLTQGISEQKEVTKQYYQDILELDTNLYNTILSNNATKVNELNDYYKTDIANFKSLAGAKNEVETTLLTSLSKKWSDYYSAQAGASEIARRAQSSPLNSGIWGAAGGKDLNNAAVKLAQEQADIKKEIAKTEQFMYNQMKDLFVNTDYTGLTVDSILLNSDKSSKDTKTTDKFSQIFDWLSIRIDKLKEKAQSTIDSIAKYTSYKTKNSKIDIAVQAKVDEKSSLKTIQDSYNNMAKKVELPPDYQKLVDEGGINVQTITDEKLAGQIEEYTKWKDAAKAVGESIEGINDEIKTLQSQKLDNIKSYFDMKNSYTESKISKRESLISLKEAQGGTASKSDYNYLIELQNDIISNIKGEYDATSNLFNQQVKDGIIKKGSSEYYEGLSYLNDLTISAREAQTSLIDLSNEKIKLTFEPFDNKMTKSNKVISEIDQATGFVEADSIEQITLFQTGYTKATQNVKDLNAEITKLNKQYKGNTNDVLYKERLADLESQLSSNASAMQSYEQSIISAMKARYDKQLDLSKDALDLELKNIEKLKKAKIDSLNDELDKYKEIIDARKKALRDEQETDNYDESVAEYNKDISKIESRIATLKQAELSGDMTARKERLTAEEELDELKKDLAKLQKDRSIDLAEDALDAEYDTYEEMKNKQISDAESFYDLQTEQAQSVYDNKALQLETLYENERKLITEAAQLTKDKFSEAFTSINSTMSNYGLGTSSDLSSAFSSGGSYANTTANPQSVSSILGKGNNYNQNTVGMSGLNEYLASKGYKMVNTKQMVELAKSLGLSDINSPDLVGTDDIGKVNKNRILKALINSGFKNGGIATTKSSRMLSGILGKTGEDGFVLARNGEGFIEPSSVPAIKEFVNLAPRLTDMFKNLEVNRLPNVTTNNNNNKPSIIIQLPPSTTITKDAMSDYRKFIPEITTAVSKEIMNGSRSK